MRRGLIAAAGTALLLAACSSGSTATPPAASTFAATPAASSASPAPSPSPTIMTKKMAKAAYLDAVCPGNAAWDRITVLVGGKTASSVDVAKVHAAARHGTKVFRHGYLLLTEPDLPWPSNVSKDIAVVANGMLTNVDQMGSLASAKGGDGIVEAVYRIQQPPGKERRAVQKIRLLLGLPAAGSGKSGCP